MPTGKPLGVEEIGLVALGTVENHRIVPGARIANDPVLRIENHVEHRNEHALSHVVRNEVIHFGHHVGSVLVASCFHPQRRTDHRHNQRTGDALAGYIRDHDAKGIVIDLDEVVVVSADLFRRLVVAARCRSH